MRDADIRRALHLALQTEHSSDPDTLIRHEVGVNAGKRRIDVVLVNGELTGYEIKSDEDTLARLAGQSEAYGQVLDRAILVTTQRHLEAATDMLPTWWGVMVAKPRKGAIRLNYTRKPTLNRQHDPFSLAQLLWRDEALEELSIRNAGRGLSKKARHYVWVALADAVHKKELRSIVRARLKARPDWSGGRL